MRNVRTCPDIVYGNQFNIDSDYVDIMDKIRVLESRSLFSLYTHIVLAMMSINQAFIIGFCSVPIRTEKAGRMQIAELCHVFVTPL